MIALIIAQLVEQQTVNSISSLSGFESVLRLIRNYRKKEQFHTKKKVKSLGTNEGRTRISEFVVLSANH